MTISDDMLFRTAESILCVLFISIAIAIKKVITTRVRWVYYEGSYCENHIKNEHVPEIKHFQNCNGSGKCIFNVFAFRRPLQHLLIQLVYASMLWLIFPQYKWLWGKNRPHQSLCDREPGRYVQVQEQQDNSLGEQSSREISILPTGDSQGGWLLSNSRDDNDLE